MAAPPPQPHPVHPKIWQACAGAVTFPKIGSKIYYFPIGHAESGGLPPSIFDAHDVSPSILCMVSAINLLADPHTDEVFYKILLTPLTEADFNVPEVQEAEDDGEVVSVVKILTQSHLNSSTFIPISCANTILPALDHQDPKASQLLSVRDVHGKTWIINHTRSAGRNLFTTGWSQFVNEKKLVAGDAIVYIKDTSQDIIFGIRRRKRILAGKVTESAVLEAVQLAEQKTAFEVACYPHNMTDFLVDGKVVDDAMKIAWNCGIRVRLLPQKVESNQPLLQPEGTICRVSDVLTWRMLEVNWDIFQNPNVNPWQVEIKGDGGMQGARHQSKENIGNSRSFKLFGKVIQLSDSDKDAT